MTSTLDRLNNAPWPGAQDSWVDQITDELGKKRYPLSQEAINWLLPLQNSVNAAAQQVGVFVDLDAQDDAIPATDFDGGSLVTGLYQLAIWSLVEVPDGVSSAVQVTITYTSHGVVQQFIGTNVNGNTTTSKSQQVVPLWIDENTAVTYQTAYASNTPNAMQYQLTIALTLIKARS